MAVPRCAKAPAAPNAGARCESKAQRCPSGRPDNPAAKNADDDLGGKKAILADDRLGQGAAQRYHRHLSSAARQARGLRGRLPGERVE